MPEHRTYVSETVRVPIYKLDALFRQAEEMLAIKLSADQRIAELRELGELIEKSSRTTKGLRSHLHAMLQELKSRQPILDALGNAGMTESIDELDKVDSGSRFLMKSITEIIAAARSDHRALGKMVDNLLEDTKKMLMMPISRMFESLPKIARDLAYEQGKELEVEIQDSDIEIDRRIQEEMKDPLMHLIRNCVDHGIEKKEIRKRKNKSERGKIKVSVIQREGGRAEIVISDDGAGIDHTRVLAVAKQSGIVSPEEAAQLKTEDIESLVFRSGLSTSPILTDISGRGLGLAIVREKVENLYGTITVDTKADAGASFHITLPVTLSAFRGVVVRTQDRLFALPSLNVERVTRVRTADIKTVENREMLNLNGNTLSLMRLAEVLGIQRKSQTKQSGDLKHVVVLVFGDERIAFMVDGILGEQEILLKGLGSQLARVRNIAGTTALGTGELVPVLNVSDLLKSSARAAISPDAGIKEQPLAEAGEKSILVVEDSITARALLRNILQAAGYHVKTAVDGVDALTILKTEPFDMVVSDVEMPRMDGFNLTIKIRADKKLAELPVVLVTALDSRENRERGIEAGANAYITKSGFDETGLLKVIDRLI